MIIINSELKTRIPTWLSIPGKPSVGMHHSTLKWYTELWTLSELVTWTLNLMLEPLLYSLDNDITCNYPCHQHITIWCFDDIISFLVGNPHACVQMSECVIPHSEHVCLSGHTQTNSMGSEILTLGIHCDTFPQGPRCTLAFSSPG